MASGLSNLALANLFTAFAVRFESVVGQRGTATSAVRRATAFHTQGGLHILSFCCELTVTVRAATEPSRSVRHSFFAFIAAKAKRIPPSQTKSGRIDKRGERGCTDAQ